MPVITLVCAKCGGTIELDSSRDFGFCVYCGTKILIERDRSDAGSVDGIRRLMLLNRDDPVKTRSYAEEIIRINPDDPVAWYFLSISKGSVCDDNALNFGVRSCGSASGFMKTVSGYLESNEAGFFDTRVAKKLKELYPGEFISQADYLIDKYSGWNPEKYDDETIAGYNRAVDEISALKNGSLTVKETIALASLKSELDSKMKSLESSQGPWRRRKVTCRAAGASNGEAGFAIQCGTFYSVMPESGHGIFSAGFYPAAGCRLTIKWHASGDVRNVSNFKKIAGITVSRNHSTKTVWHSVSCIVSSEWDDEISLEFEKRSDRLVFVSASVSGFHISE